MHERPLSATKLEHYYTTETDTVITIFALVKILGVQVVIEQQAIWFDLYSTALSKDDGATVVKAIGDWKDNSQPLRIDYIFANHLVNAKSSTVVLNGTNGPVVSDHYGVAVEI
ncbi:hypothetical protein [Paenibacillus donghaensis]|uniref:hypothetical protein n=1 Tax=Paenibacillus donghaensis TaxID=414771 RepID=UPI0012FD61E0|nr:hypothetical protein [Paenibacillus donghaensis]